MSLSHPGSNPAREMILFEVLDERSRQLKKWGPQSHAHAVRDSGTHKQWQYQCAKAKMSCEETPAEYITWEQILWEEVAETFCEDGEWNSRRAELIQVMAVCLAEIEDGDAKNAPPPTRPAATLPPAPVEPLTQVSSRVSSRVAQAETLCNCDHVSFPHARGYHNIASGIAHPGDSEQNAAGASF